MEVFDLIKEYEEKYPNEESPINLLNSFNDDEIIEIFKEANGRKIKFENSTERLEEDQISYE